MMRWKKIAAIALAAVMMIGLAACRGTENENGTPAGSAGAETAVSDVSAEPAASVNTVILLDEDESMKNTYTFLAVNPNAPFVDENGKPADGVKINKEGAAAFIEWMLSKDTKDMIAAFGQKEYGGTLFTLLDDAPSFDGKIPQAKDDTKTIRFSTTTSVNDSGLLQTILPVFEEKYGYSVEVQSAGTGKAIAAAQSGNADVILVHAKEKEEAFVADGFSYTLDGFDSERLSFMYNYFVLCGPTGDPAGVRESADAAAAFQAIADSKSRFISRGDGSGTHVKELNLWPKELGITEDAKSFAAYTDWYVSANAGMGACLVMAEEQGAYILTDKATYLTFMSKGGKME